MDFPADSTPAIQTAMPHPPAPPRRPGIWSGIGMVLLYFVLQVAVGLVVGIVLVVADAFMVGASGHTFHAAAIAKLVKQPDVLAGLTIVILLIVAALTFWIVRLFWREQWRVASPPGFGFRMPDRPLFFLLAVVAGVALAFGGGYLTQWFAHGQPINQDVTVMGRNVTLGLRIALALVVVCVAPLVEELLFRGVLLSGLMRRMPALPAVIITAVIFGGAHLPDFKFAWYAIPALVIMGLALAWIRLKSRSLWPSITMHATNNLVAAVTWFVVAHPPHG